MGAYLLLMVLPLILSFLFYNVKDKRKNKYISIFFFSYLIIVFVFRDYSVGRDIPSYLDAYEKSSFHDWFDFDWIYMESGYIFLMKIFSTIGFTFRFFLLFLYSILVIPLSIYICRSSRDLSLSLIIYVCFQFFVFNMSGLRQTVALALCLIAFIIAHKNGKRAFFEYLLFVLAAISIHRSAIVFLPAYFIMRQKLTFRMILFYGIIAVLSIIKSNSILSYFQKNEITNYEFDEYLTIGSTFYFVLGIVILTYIFDKGKDNETSWLNTKNNIFARTEKISIGLSNYANLLACSILLLLVFNGTILMRASMFYQLALLVVLPNMLFTLPKDFRVVIKFGIIILMFAIFYFTVLVPSQFDIVPYKFVIDLNFIK